MPPRVRITSGTARGRKLISPNVYLRPMMGKVREAVFSMLIQLGGLPTTSNTNTRDEAGSSVLDLFAGLGGVGLEALSRGVRSGVFVDSSEDCVATIRENSRLCRVETRATAVCAKVEDFLRESGTYNGGEPFSLITITPPYEEVDYAQLLKSVALSSAVGDGHPYASTCFASTCSISSSESASSFSSGMVHSNSRSVPTLKRFFKSSAS